MKPQARIAFTNRVVGALAALLLCGAAGAYAASAVDVYKDPG